MSSWLWCVSAPHLTILFHSFYFSPPLPLPRPLPRPCPAHREPRPDEHGLLLLPQPEWYLHGGRCQRCQGLSRHSGEAVRGVELALSHAPCFVALTHCHSWRYYNTHTHRHTHTHTHTYAHTHHTHAHTRTHTHTHARTHTHHTHTRMHTHTTHTHHTHTPHTHAHTHMYVRILQHAQTYSL